MSPRLESRLSICSFRVLENNPVLVFEFETNQPSKCSKKFRDFFCICIHTKGVKCLESEIISLFNFSKGIVAQCKNYLNKATKSETTSTFYLKKKFP